MNLHAYKNLTVSQFFRNTADCPRIFSKILETHLFSTFPAILITYIFIMLIVPRSGNEILFLFEIAAC